MKKSIAISTTLLVALASCESAPPTYGPAAASKYGVGYSHVRLADDLYEVTFRGYGNMSYAYARDLALRRAADIGRELGYTHFTLEGERDSTTTTESLESLPIIGSDDYYEFSETIRFPRPVLRIQYYEGAPSGRHLNIYEISRVAAG